MMGGRGPARCRGLRVPDRRRPDGRLLRGLGLACAVAITLLIGSGGWVRLSESGLGCPTWPRCTATSVVAPVRYHALVEFVNRCMITTVGVLVAVTVVGAFLARPRRRDLRWLASGLVTGYVGEAVLGGITVLLKLAPALVAAHLVLAMLLLTDAVVLTDRATRPAGRVAHRRPERHLVWLSDLTLLTVGLVVTAGTVVTGSGPHSGAPGTPRFHLPFTPAAEFHAVVGMFLFGLVVAQALAVQAAHAPRRARRAAAVAVGLVALQGAVGYATYFSHVQADVTEAHVLGAALVVAALVRCRLALSPAATVDPPGAVGQRAVEGGQLGAAPEEPVARPALR